MQYKIYSTKMMLQMSDPMLPTRSVEYIIELEKCINRKEQLYVIYRIGIWNSCNLIYNYSTICKQLGVYELICFDLLEKFQCDKEMERRYPDEYSFIVNWYSKIILDTLNNL